MFKGLNNFYLPDYFGEVTEILSRLDGREDYLFYDFYTCPMHSSFDLVSLAPIQHNYMLDFINANEIFVNCVRLNNTLFKFRVANSVYGRVLGEHDALTNTVNITRSNYNALLLANYFFIPVTFKSRVASTGRTFGFILADDYHHSLILITDDNHMYTLDYTFSASTSFSTVGAAWCEIIPSYTSTNNYARYNFLGESIYLHHLVYALYKFDDYVESLIRGECFINHKCIRESVERYAPLPDSFALSNLETCTQSANTLHSNFVRKLDLLGYIVSVDVVHHLNCKSPFYGVKQFLCLTDSCLVEFSDGVCLKFKKSII